MKLTYFIGPTLVAIQVAAGAAQKATSGDSPEFLSREASVRHDFLVRYPANLGPLAKVVNSSNSTEQQLFDVSMAQVMLGKTQPANQKLPAYWRARLAGFVETQSEALARLILGRNNDPSQVDPKSVDKLAKLNMQAFRALALQYGGVASADVFDSSPPLVQARYIMTGMKGLLGDVSFPCPYTVYILDMDEEQKDDQPDYARDYFATMAGRDNGDYAHFSSFNRQQKTDAFQRAFAALIDAGQNLALHPDQDTLAGFGRHFGVTVEHSGDNLTFVGPTGGKRETDSDVVFAVYGFDGLKAFKQMSEGPAKSDMRIAAVVLKYERDSMIDPLLLG